MIRTEKIVENGVKGSYARLEGSSEELFNDLSAIIEAFFTHEELKSVALMAMLHALTHESDDIEETLKELKEKRTND